MRGQPVPILSGVDLAFHEASHFLTSFLPRILYFAGGSIGQILWPLGIGIAFLVANKDFLGAGLCFAWAGTAAQHVSQYVADAPTMNLPLIGGLHDWNTVLGPDHLDALTSADDLAKMVWVFGLALWVAGISMCAWGPWAVRARAKREAAEARTAASGAGASATVPTEPSEEGWAVVPPWERAVRSDPDPDASHDGPPVAPSP